MFRLCIALGVLSMASPVFAQADQEVLKAEQSWIAARQVADAATLTRLIADDFAQVATSGQIQDKKYATTRPASAKLGSRDLKVQVFGDAAVVTGIGLGIGAGEVRQTRVWQRQSGQWMLVFLQNTPILAAAQAAAQPPSGPAPAATVWPQGATPAELEVLKVQRGLNDAFARKDVKTYGTLTAESFERIGPNGSLTARDGFLKNVAGSPDVKRVESNNSDFRYRAFGPVAVLTYIDRAWGAAPAGIRMTRVFVEQKGAWRQLVGQSTPVAQP